MLTICDDLNVESLTPPVIKPEYLIGVARGKGRVQVRQNKSDCEGVMKRRSRGQTEDLFVRRSKEEK
jgi:hypothetical protein